MSKSKSEQRVGKMSTRSILIGLAFVLILCAITPYNNFYLQNSSISNNHLPVGAVFALLFLVMVINIPLRKLKERFALTPAELATVWIMLIVSLSIPSLGFLNTLLPNLVAGTYFATPENEWMETLHPHIPDWLWVSDSRAARDIYEGVGSSGLIPWKIWIKPLCVWSLFRERSGRVTGSRERVGRHGALG